MFLGRMVVVSGDTPSEAYLAALSSVLDWAHHECSPRGQKIMEILNFAVEIENPSSEPIQTLSDERNEIIAQYTKKEFELYTKGVVRADDFSTASKFWSKLANPDGTVNSAYGHLIFYDPSCGNPGYELHGVGPLTGPMRTPWQWARQALINDKDTRQAIVKFHKREHLWVGNKDQVCTVYAIFHIRDDILTMTVHMRSQDLVYGMVYDIPWFCWLQERMLKDLEAVYPDLTLGRYTHIADSAHIYYRNMDAVNQMLGA